MSGEASGSQASGAAPVAGQQPSGSLRELPLPRLLIDAYRKRRSGWLVLSRSGACKRLRLDHGAPLTLRSSLERDSLLTVLEEQKLLPGIERARIERDVREGDELRAVLKSRKVAPKPLLLAVRAQVRRALSECFGWADGEFAFESAEGSPAGIAALRSDPYALVRDGIEAHWSPEKILETLTPRMSLFVTPGEGFDDALARLGEPGTAACFEKLRTGDAFAGAITSAIGSPRALATLWVLDAASALNYSEARADDCNEEAVPDSFGAEIEIEVTAGTRPMLAAIGKPRAAAASSKPDGKAAELADEIEDLYAQLDALTHYDLLGVPEDVAPGDLRKAYFKAAKRFHPDALNRLGLENLRDEAGALFARIAEANDVLSDDSRRKEYDAVLRGDHREIDTGRLAQAEAFFRKGEVLIRMGNFGGSIEFLEPAVELWPDEAAYQSALGWALHKKNPPDDERARQHLTRALELAPDDSESHFRMGMLLRALGEHDRSANHLANAKSLD